MEPPNSAEESLESFRRQWQEEISSRGRQNNESEEIYEGFSPPEGHHDILDESSNAENKATNLYLKGVKHEQSGDMVEAIRHYKQAIKLVPNIEELMYAARVAPVSSSNVDKVAAKLGSVALREDSNDNETNENCDITDLFSKLVRIFEEDGQICTPFEEPKMTHISSLPREIIVVLLKWIISTDLDLNSLEKLASVCRGFYVCCRHIELWKLACAKMWKSGCGDPQTHGYTGWREMYILRARPYFNGCYISKTSYSRAGENSFQDVNYKPWHLVSYFRYLRFFACGSALMLTTSDSPQNVVTYLKKDWDRSNLAKGSYSLQDNIMTAVFKKKAATAEPLSRFRRKKDQNNNTGSTVAEQIFYAEIEVVPKKHRRNCILSWRRYSVETVYLNGARTTTELEVQSSRFPYFSFSPVRSYITESNRPLGSSN